MQLPVNGFHEKIKPFPYSISEWKMTWERVTGAGEVGECLTSTCMYVCIYFIFQNTKTPIDLHVLLYLIFF